MVAKSLVSINKAACLAALALASLSPAGAQLVGQYGILDLAANGGINPNTGNPWQAGDQYRLAFFSSGTITATSNDPADYDAFATAQANLSTLGNGAITTSTGWTAMVWVNTDPDQPQGDALSSPVVRSGTGDLTGGAGIGGAGVPVYAMNGTTAIARNNADIYNSWSNPFDSDATIRLAAGTTNLNSDGNEVTASQNVHYSPFLNQFGLGDTANVHGVNVMTGGFGSHVNAVGPSTETNSYSWGSTNANSPGRVWNRFTEQNLAVERPVYAISPLLTVQTAPAEAFQLRIAPSATNPGNFDFEWDSQPDKVYDLVTSTDLATPILDWPVYDPDGEGPIPPYAAIPATGTTTTLTEVPGDGPKRFFAMLEKDVPPLFSWDFEDDNGGFTATGTPNDWAWGAPNSDSGAGLVLTTGNGDSVNCWGTNLGAGGNPSGLIDPSANSILRSPNIDLTGITGAQLSFAAAYDAAVGDVIEIVIRDAGTGDPIGDPITPVDTTSATSSNWTTLGPFDLSAADNTNIYLEFRYDGTDAAYIGLYIDDVTVTQ